MNTRTARCADCGHLLAKHGGSGRCRFATCPCGLKQVAEEIAQAIEAKASDTSYSEPEQVTEHLLATAKLVREIGGAA